MISLSSIVGVILYLIVGGLIYWLLTLLIDAIPLPDPFQKVAKVALLVLAVLFIINLLLGLVGNPIVRIVP